MNNEAEHYSKWDNIVFKAVGVCCIIGLAFMDNHWAVYLTAAFVLTTSLFPDFSARFTVKVILLIMKGLRILRRKEAGE